MYHPREDLSIFNKKILLVLFLVYVVLTVLFAIMMVCKPSFLDTNPEFPYVSLRWIWH